MKTSEREKVAIVLSGGGMRCAHGAGFLYGLATQFPEFKADIIVAGSGSTAGAAAYIAHYIEEIRKVWTQILLDNRKFISFRRFPIIDINYLIDGVFKRVIPATGSRLEETTTQFFFPVRNIHSGELMYMSNDAQEDIYETLRAAQALPGVFNEKICLEEDHYIDGYFGLTPKSLVKKAVEEGATRIILIENNLTWTFTVRLLGFLAQLLFLPKSVRRQIRKDLFLERNFTIPTNINIERILISKKMKINPLANSANKLRPLFWTGVREVNNPAVRLFMERKS